MIDGQTIHTESPFKQSTLTPHCEGVNEVYNWW